MLRIECPPLPQSLQAHLAQHQAGNHQWNSLGRTENDEEIKARLTSAFHQKCGYCEHIEAETVDHFWPRDHYPDRCWDWDNFILACDICQRKKSNKRPVNEAGVQMVNPRQDEPLRYLTIDFETGLVSALPTTPATEAIGELTLERLALSERPSLSDERRRKLWDILNYIGQVIDPKVPPHNSQQAWTNLLDHLSPTKPYLAVIRQLFLTQNEYTPLVDRLRQMHPEIDEYIQVWCLLIQDF